MNRYPFSLLVAIDPGASGAAAICRPDRAEDTCVLPYSGDETVAEIARICREVGGVPFVLIEEVHASPIMRPAGAFAFGDNFGAWRCALKSHGIAVFGVSPQRWQREFPEVTGKDDERKRQLKAVAGRLFPAQRVTLNNADALLLLHYLQTQLSQGKTPGRRL